MRWVIRIFLILQLVLHCSTSAAESVFVKSRGIVSLNEFTCTTPDSSFVNRICYHGETQYLLVLLGDAYYHYCRVPPDIFSRWTQAESKGRYYYSFVKGNFDCRMGGIPMLKN